MERNGIYYWKCDRASAFHGTDGATGVTADDVRAAVEAVFPDAAAAFTPAGGQGNHRTFAGRAFGRDVFVRIEDGAEKDDYFAVETAASRAVAACGVPVADGLAYDCSRRTHPFAWQILAFVRQPDLNRHFKDGTLDWRAIAPAIGRAVAAWQGAPVEGFGPFSAAAATAGRGLRGLCGTYRDYFTLNLDRHLGFLETHGFTDGRFTARVRAAVQTCRDLLALRRGVLVHKDLALWNILGTPTEIAAFIDWDDCIAGDPMDDLSLLGCFHGADAVGAALEGYREVRVLPAAAPRRFWLCLLRNMLFKAVIRVGAGYFDRRDDFFLMRPGGDGGDLAAATRARLDLALRGIEKGLDFDALD